MPTQVVVVCLLISVSAYYAGKLRGYLDGIKSSHPDDNYADHG